MGCDNILVGAASFADKTLIACGRFYPPGLPAAERLPFYAERFALLEMDSLYYALPSPTIAHGWAQRTPAGFTIDVKAFRALTGHQTPIAALPADLRRELDETEPVVWLPQLPPPVQRELWHRFLLGLEPLRQAGRLGSVLFQFPPWIRAGVQGRAFVRHCARMMEGVPMAVEFRHRSWFAGARADDTLAFLGELGAAHVVVDAPQGFANTVPAVWEVTRPELAVMRLHGRNAAAWNNAGPHSGSRFDYVYSEAELADLARQARALARRADSVHVVFNTNREDQGMVNAGRFAQALLA